MVSTFIATSLHVPKLRDNLVERQRLSDRIRGERHSKLTLVSAPAGFGKTTLLAEWLATSINGRAVAWLSLDQTDNERTAFWSHVVAALQTAAARLGATFPDLLPAGAKADEAFPSSLLNALGEFSSEVELVLDDYHVIDQPDIAAGLSLVLEHLPSNTHLVISTRSDPALPLGRLRARGELTEIRASDLRFTEEESTAYLNVKMRLGLSTKDVAILGERTEGWVTALQLAVLSLHGRADTSAFIAAFAGSDRFIVDYLIEEVLERLPNEVRLFLFRTCFLSRLNGSLCDAITRVGGGTAMLAALDRQNLFVVPLDDRRQWYRYHHLFADVLLGHTPEGVRAELQTLQRRAGDWYEQEGDRRQAITHFLAGKDFERAAALMELAIQNVQKLRGEATIKSWMLALPVELVRQRPVLGMGFVGALASLGELGDIERRLNDIEWGVAELGKATSPISSASGVVVVDASQLPRMSGAVELYRTALAQARGDMAGIIDHAKRVLSLAPADDHVSRAAASSLLGIAYWSAGNLEQARRLWSEGRDGLARAGHIADMLGVTVGLADICTAQGHLNAAKSAYVQALDLAAAQDGSVLRGTSDMYAGLAALACERGEREQARQHLLQCRELGEVVGLPQHPYRWRVTAAWLQRSQGDIDGAAALLDEAVRLYVADYFPNVRPVPSIRARLQIGRGQLDSALQWQRETGVGIDDELSYLREYDHITLARLLIAQGATGDDLLQFIARLLDAAMNGGRTGSVIELSILQARVVRSSDPAGSLLALERALSLAEPEGNVRLFTDEGGPIASLLHLAVKRRICPAYARKLLANFDQTEASPNAHPDLLEPMSERELDVLRLLRSDLGGPEIARELMVSENTMRTHTKNIYEKLGVNSRRSAVRRAEELGLFGRSATR